MIVVADTTPLNYLIRLGHINILKVLYGEILIPHAVQEEMLNSRAPSTVRNWIRNPPEWLQLLSPSTQPVPSIPRLDRGEAEAIALAEELRADLLLIDEAAGRDEAASRGLQTIGTLGILREAHLAGILNLRQVLGELRQLGFHVRQSLIDKLLASV